MVIHSPNKKKKLIFALERIIGRKFVNSLRKVYDSFLKSRRRWSTLCWKMILNRVNIWKNKRKPKRCLEIGSGNERLKGFETLNIVGGRNVDYVFDAAKPLPFENETFDLIYASHILEHIVWYHTETALAEWVRILKPGGTLEVWVPDGLKICQTLINAELNDVNDTAKDGWYKFNPRKDPCIWANGRIFTYGDGTGNPKHPNWHKAIFTPRYLKELFEIVGLRNIREIDNAEVRGYDHGWINLGMRGTKL